MRIHYLQHVAFEGIGSIQRWADSHGHALTHTRFFDGQVLPPLTSFDALVVMGGPMNVYEEREYPWLSDEKRFIRGAIDGGKLVLGICLGAQLLATVLGARVMGNSDKEIGWFPIEWTHEVRALPGMETLPARSPVFHWHGDTYDLPVGATRVASSDGCLNQGFIYGDRVLALQFHLEVTAEGAQALIQNCGNELVGGKYIQSAAELLSDAARFTRINALLDGILNALVATR